MIFNLKIWRGDVHKLQLSVICCDTKLPKNPNSNPEVARKARSGVREAEEDGRRQEINGVSTRRQDQGRENPSSR